MRVFTEQEKLEQLLPIRLVKQREKDEEREVDKCCKFHTYGYQCYNMLKWDYCKYIHSDEIKKAYQLIQQQSVTST